MSIQNAVTGQDIIEMVITDLYKKHDELSREFNQLLGEHQALTCIKKKADHD